jgi:hypothetical protein
MGAGTAQRLSRACLPTVRALVRLCKLCCPAYHVCSAMTTPWYNLGRRFRLSRGLWYQVHHVNKSNEPVLAVVH